MIIRKPTKIELKPEDDFYEYEEFKKKQQEMAKKPVLDSKQGSKLPDKMLIEPSSNPFKMSMANEIFKTPSVGMTAPHNLNPSMQVPNTSSNQFESFNLVRSQVANPDFDMSSIRNDSPHINQLFSLLLNNLNSGGQNFSNLYSSGNGNNDNANPQHNNNNPG